MKSTYFVNNLEFTFDDSDIVNIDYWDPASSETYTLIRPFLLHDHGFTLAVVFAKSMEDAIDTAAAYGRLAAYEIQSFEWSDYSNFDHVRCLTDTEKSFDIESLGVVELPNPAQSFCAQFNNSFRKEHNETA